MGTLLLGHGCICTLPVIRIAFTESILKLQCIALCPEGKLRRHAGVAAFGKEDISLNPVAPAVDLLSILRDTIAAALHDEPLTICSAPGAFDSCRRGRNGCRLGLGRSRLCRFCTTLASLDGCVDPLREQIVLQHHGITLRCFENQRHVDGVVWLIDLLFV